MHLLLELHLTGVSQWQENTLCNLSQDARVLLCHMQLLHVQGAFEICIRMRYFSSSVNLNAHWALQLWFMCTFMHKMANSFSFALNNNIVTIAIWRASVSCLVQIQVITVIIFTTLDRMQILWQWKPTHKTGNGIKNICSLNEAIHRACCSTNLSTLTVCLLLWTQKHFLLFCKWQYELTVLCAPTPINISF